MATYAQLNASLQSKAGAALRSFNKSVTYTHNTLRNDMAMEFNAANKVNNGSTAPARAVYTFVTGQSNYGWTGSTSSGFSSYPAWESTWADVLSTEAAQGNQGDIAQEFPVLSTIEYNAGVNGTDNQAFWAVQMSSAGYGTASGSLGTLWNAGYNKTFGFRYVDKTDTVNFNYTSASDSLYNNYLDGGIATGSKIHSQDVIDSINNVVQRTIDQIESRMTNNSLNSTVCHTSCHNSCHSSRGRR